MSSAPETRITRESRPSLPPRAAGQNPLQARFMVRKTIDVPPPDVEPGYQLVDERVTTAKDGSTTAVRVYDKIGKF